MLNHHPGWFYRSPTSQVGLATTSTRQACRSTGGGKGGRAMPFTLMKQSSKPTHLHIYFMRVRWKTWSWPQHLVSVRARRMHYPLKVTAWRKVLSLQCWGRSGELRWPTVQRKSPQCNHGNRANFLKWAKLHVTAFKVTWSYTSLPLLFFF